MKDVAGALLHAYLRGYTPPPRMSVPDWADQYRVLASEAGSSAGRFSTATHEAARGPMLAITEPGVRTITVMACTQLMKTTVLENCLGYHAHLDPAPMLLVSPKDDSARAFSKERIRPMVRRTPVLRDIMAGPTARSDGAGLLYWPFAGGFLALGSAGSPTDLASRPIRLVLFDEIDKYATTREGDPISLAEERQATFDANSLSIRVCSPTVDEESRIQQSFNESDQRRASIACPHCAHRLFPDFFRHVDWDKIRRDDGAVVQHLHETAGITCEGCGVKWSEGDRLLALRTIRWHQTRPFECCKLRRVPMDLYEAAWRAGLEDPLAVAWDWWTDPGPAGRWAVYRARCPDCGTWGVANEHAGFQASKLLSPRQRDRPRDIARKWLAAQVDILLMQAWWNTQAGLPYRPSSGRTLGVDALLQRREVWAGDVPPGGALLTVAMDTQETWVELETVAWGLDEESWSIDHTRIEGEFRDPSVQAQVDAYLLRTWWDAFGRTYRVSAACLDSGGNHTQAVYDFAKARLQRRVWAIKGASERDGQRNPVWPTKKPSRKTKASFRPIILGGNTARDTIRARLTTDPPPPGTRCPGYMHFPADRDVGYFEQIIADRRELREAGGRKYTVWVTPPGRANEAADLKVYNYAALCGLVHLGLGLNRYVLQVLEAPLPGQGPPQAPRAAAAPGPSERRLSITEAPRDGGKKGSIASRIA